MTQTLLDITELGREGGIVYFVDGTGYDYPDGSGRAIQVWQQQPHRERETYCLLSGWEQSPAYRRIADPKKEFRDQPSFRIHGTIHAQII